MSVGDLLSPTFNCPPFLPNRRQQVSTPCPWGIVSSRLGGRTTVIDQTMVSIDVMISASGHPLQHALQHPPYPVHHMPPATCLPVPGSRKQEEWSFPQEGFGGWKTLSLWKLGLIDGSRFVDALASTRLKVCGMFDADIDVANILV